MKLLIKYPTRSRPNLFQKTLERYFTYLSGKIDTQFIISIDRDDPSMNNSEILSWTTSKPNVQIKIGDSKTKIEAINSDIPQTGWDVLLMASDDMTPVVRNYDQILCDAMQLHFPDTDGALWFNDGRVGDVLNTLPILGNKYYQRFGYVYHPEYKSLWCDNEYQMVAQKLNKLIWINQVIIRHDWKDATGEDALYRRNETTEHYTRDGATFAQRYAKGFK